MDIIVSIIIPTYKRPEALIDAIKSVSEQTLKHWELLIVDDNAPDSEDRAKTRTLVSEYLSRGNIKYIEHSENKGACAARNTGAQYAQGKYIAFLDDDDLWFANKLEVQVSALESSSAVLCYCDMYLQYNGYRQYFHCVEKEQLLQKLLLQGFGICTSALVIEKSAFEKVGGFDESLPSMQDYDLLLRITLQFHCEHIKEPLLTYRLANDGISCNPEAKSSGHKAILKKYFSTYQSLKLSKGIARQYESIGDFELRCNRRVNAIQYYLKSIKYNFMNRRIYLKLLFGTLFGSKPLLWFLAKRQQRNSEKLT